MHDPDFLADVSRCVVISCAIAIDGLSSSAGGPLSVPPSIGRIYIYLGVDSCGSGTVDYEAVVTGYHHRSTIIVSECYGYHYCDRRNG